MSFLFRPPPPSLLTPLPYFFALDLPPAALAALRGSVSAYLFTLVMCQAVHLYVVKTRRTSVFVHPICANWMSQLGVVISIGVAVLCIYPLQGSLFGTGDMDYWVSWTLWILFGITLIPITESFKCCARRGWTTFP
jgi:magnesium-transporting ATPase (P-type)